MDLPETETTVTEDRLMDPLFSSTPKPDMVALGGRIPFKSLRIYSSPSLARVRPSPESVHRPSPSIARVRPSLESAPKKSLTVEPAPKKSLTTEFVLRPPAPKKSLSAHLATPRQPIRPWINSEVWDAYGNPDINHYGGKVSLFFRLFVRSFACLIVHSFIYSFIRSLIYLLIHSILRSFLHSFIPSFIHSFLRSFILLGGEGSDTRGGYGGDGRGGNPLRRSWWRGGQPFIRDEVNSA